MSDIFLAQFKGGVSIVNTQSSVAQAKATTASANVVVKAARDTIFVMPDLRQGNLLISQQYVTEFEKKFGKLITHTNIAQTINKVRFPGRQPHYDVGNNGTVSPYGIPVSDRRRQCIVMVNIPEDMVVYDLIPASNLKNIMAQYKPHPKIIDMLAFARQDGEKGNSEIIYIPMQVTGPDGAVVRYVRGYMRPHCVIGMLENIPNLLHNFEAYSWSLDLNFLQPQYGERLSAFPRLKNAYSVLALLSSLGRYVGQVHYVGAGSVGQLQFQLLGLHPAQFILYDTETLWGTGLDGGGTTSCITTGSWYTEPRVYFYAGQENARLPKLFADKSSIMTYTLSSTPDINGYYVVGRRTKDCDPAECVKWMIKTGVRWVYDVSHLPFGGRKKFVHQKRFWEPTSGVTGVIYDDAMIDGSRTERMSWLFTHMHNVKINLNLDRCLYAGKMNIVHPNDFKGHPTFTDRTWRELRYLFVKPCQGNKHESVYVLNPGYGTMLDTFDDNGVLALDAMARRTEVRMLLTISATFKILVFAHNSFSNSYNVGFTAAVKQLNSLKLEFLITYPMAAALGQQMVTQVVPGNLWHESARRDHVFTPFQMSGVEEGVNYMPFSLLFAIATGNFVPSDLIGITNSPILKEFDYGDAFGKWAAHRYRLLAGLHDPTDTKKLRYYSHRDEIAQKWIKKLPATYRKPYDNRHVAGHLFNCLLSPCSPSLYICRLKNYKEHDRSEYMLSFMAAVEVHVEVGLPLSKDFVYGFKQFLDYFEYSAEERKAIDTNITAVLDRMCKDTSAIFNS